MSEKKKSILPRLELLIILVFFVSFIFWAVSKCSFSQAEIQQEAIAAESTPTDSRADSTPASARVSTPVPDTLQRPPAANPNNQRFTPLYVTISGLNMRKEPNLKSEVLDKLALFEEVEFRQEVTDSIYTVNLSETVIASYPWIKIRNKKGKEGWVFGAGVHYYKMKYPGME